jgi:UDP-glucuronate 4-epimerase
VSRYLVTGAAGFIGSHLAGALGRSGHEVAGVDCFTDYYEPALKEENARGLDVERVDLADASLSSVLGDVDGVFHLAGQPGVRTSFGAAFPHYVRRNILATQRVFEAAAQAGVRVVFASSSSIYGEAERYPTPEDVVPRPLSPYGITKLSAEHLARAYARSFGLDVVVLRYFNAYGPRQRPDMAFPRVVEALVAGRPFTLFGDGEQSRSFTYVGDVVEASILAMERAVPGTTYNEALAALEQIAGRTLDVRREPAVPGDQRRTKADTTRILNELGWSPRTPLAEGLRAQWEWAQRGTAVESAL